MGAKSQSAKTYPVPIDYFIGKLRAVGTAGLNVALKSENPMPNGVWFRIHHGTTFTSWGEKITVTLTDLGGSTAVDILSECGMPTQMVDWGKNASNVRVLFDYLEKDMTAEPQAEPQAAAPTASPAFCPSCGSKLPTGARFCPVCGNKIQ